MIFRIGQRVMWWGGTFSDDEDHIGGTIVSEFPDCDDGYGSAWVYDGCPDEIHVLWDDGLEGKHTDDSAVAPEVFIKFYSLL